MTQQTKKEEWTIRMPDDWHLHFRQGNLLKQVAPVSAQHFSRALLMPNLTPPLFRMEEALAYQAEVVRVVEEEQTVDASFFHPFATLYLHPTLSKTEIVKLSLHRRESFLENNLPKVIACKLYPKGVTTNSDAGIRKVEELLPLLEIMTKYEVPLCIHGEVAEEGIDVFEREKKFLQTWMEVILKNFPTLKVTLEHISTKEGVEYVRSHGEKKSLAASITLHHLYLNRNHMLQAGLRPHYYCKPLLQTQGDQRALLQAALSGDRCFFFGSDSAPHQRKDKENVIGCAGVYSAPLALPALAALFEFFAPSGKWEDESSWSSGSLPNETEIAQSFSLLEKFCSLNGSLHYGLPLNTKKLKLRRQSLEEKGNERGFLEIEQENAIKEEKGLVVFNPFFASRWIVN